MPPQRVANDDAPFSVSSEDRKETTLNLLHLEVDDAEGTYEGTRKRVDSIEPPARIEGQVRCQIGDV